MRNRFPGAVEEEGYRGRAKSESSRAFAIWNRKAKSISATQPAIPAMKSWSENITFTAPLRDVRPAGPAQVMTATDPAMQDQWHASYELGRIEGEKALSEHIVQGSGAELHELSQRRLNCVAQILVSTGHPRRGNDGGIAGAGSRAKTRGRNANLRADGGSRGADALSQVEGTAQFTVRLHPADLELLQKSDSPILIAQENSKEFRFLVRRK